MREIKFLVWNTILNRMSLKPVKTGDVFVDFGHSEVERISPYQLTAPGNVFRQFTGLTDKGDNELYDGDITSLEVDRETRYFKVAIKTVVREVVSHPTFSDDTAKVAITAVVFEWNGFDLFPCVDKDGVPDNKRMKKVGNIYENPELLEVK